MKKKREKLTNKEIGKRLDYLLLETRNILTNLEYTYNLFLHYVEFSKTGDEFKKYVDKIRENSNGNKDGKQSLRDSSTKDRGSDKRKLQTKKGKLQTAGKDTNIKQPST